MSTVVSTKEKKVYFFGGSQAEGDASLRNTIGGKGANLAEMVNMNIPVPPGFTISTQECLAFYENNESLSEDLKSEVAEHILRVELDMGSRFGDSENPLLFSVRSGARISMPGMMDTILNLGLNDASVEGLAKRSGSDRFAWDSYRRFIQMFSNVVLGIDHHNFESILTAKKAQNGVDQDTDLTVDDLKDIVNQFKQLVAERGHQFPEDPTEQLYAAIGAVFKSWHSDRANKYRKINKIPNAWGTAVNVQTMVFGNLGPTSGTGVAFTRDPGTGEKEFYGEFLMNAQGEDVVAGIRTPQPISELKAAMPEAYDQLVEIYKNLENHFTDMQDMEFTIQDRKLYLLQTRNGKRTAAAAVKIAVDMVNEGLISKEQAIMRVSPDQIDQLLHPMIDPKAETAVLAKGLPASPGAAVGKIIFTADEAEQWASEGQDVVLVREETSPEDIGGMDAAKGILTARGGMTSHAAVVARGMGKPCVAGCSSIRIQEKEKTLTIGDKTFREGDHITLNGSTGEVIEGKVPLIQAELSGAFHTLMEFVDDVRQLKVRANAETPQDATNARQFGAEGIGLCRTEHMFFEGDRILAVREMILAENVTDREKALAKLLPFQRHDFVGIFKAMEGLPVTVRLLDPPLHEFLPHDEKSVQDVAKSLGLSAAKVQHKVEVLKEFNPMLGHRGCRLAITFPEIYDMQTHAIVEAAIELTQSGVTVIPEIMIPLIQDKDELATIKARVKTIADALVSKSGVTLNYTIGTMIEVPRAALLADQIAEEAEFFSFGTNDLTQMTCGLSRDDSGRFLPHYVEAGFYKEDPFQSLDQEGVGGLIQWGVKQGRSVNPRLKIGICGEHGGDPQSVEFFHQNGFDYVSCSPYRVPIARLAAAQAVVKSAGTS